MLRWRLILGPILIAALLGIFSLDSRLGPAAPLLLVLSIILGLRSVWELHQLLLTRNFEPEFPLPAVCVLSVIVASWVPRWIERGDVLTRLGDIGPSLLMFGLSLVVLFARSASRYESPGKSMETLGAELLILCYCGAFSALTIQLRWVPDPTSGYFAFGSLVVVTKCGDIAAYVFGRLYGKAKLVPRLSPGKTWAGFWGALGGGALAAFAWFQLTTPLFLSGHTPPHWYWAILYGLLVSFTGLVGDLCESLIKRDVGKKDSAVLLPGFGGLLDLLDSVIFTGPVAYLLWLVLPLAGKPG